MKNIRGFAFVGNPIEVKGKLPFAISDRLTLNLASPTQRRKIKRYLKSLGGHLNNYEPFECMFESLKIVPERPLPDDIEIVELRRKRLPSLAWRYYVVEFHHGTVSFESGCAEIESLRAASHLTAHSPRISPTFTLGMISSPDFTGDWEFFTGIAADGGTPIHINPYDLNDLQHCYANTYCLMDTYPDIARSIKMFNELPLRNGYNELTTLGIFSVLESLLTHNPKGEYDSIGHQIRSKMALIEMRLRKPIDYSGFAKTEKDTVWKKLYELRSRIAHGGEIDFDKSLSVLVGTYEVESFLKSVVRLILRAALEEPDLFVALRPI